MASTKIRSHKHFRLDPAKIKRAKRLLAVDTETVAIDKALDIAISECEKNRIAQRANEEFIKSRAQN